MKKRIKKMIEKINSIIISAFPGTGKTYYSKNNNNCFDSDSSDFSWIPNSKPKQRNPDFPENYFNHILNELVGKKRIIFISSHEKVRRYMIDNNIYYNLIYPHKSLKNEYIERFKKRGNDDNFIEFIDKNWNRFIDELIEQTYCTHTILNSNEYINNYMGLFQFVTTYKNARLFIDINGCAIERP